MRIRIRTHHISVIVCTICSVKSRRSSNYCLLRIVHVSSRLYGLVVRSRCLVQAKVDALTEGSGGSGIVGGSTLFDGAAVGATVAASPGLLNATDKVDALDDTTLSKVGSKKHLLVGQRLKTALRVPRPNAGRLVQQFKVAASMSRARYVRTYDAHRDGVWHVDCASTNAGVRAAHTHARKCL
jgi:hypothetical protein